MRRVVLAIVAVLLVASVVGAAGGKPEPETYDVKNFSGNSCHAFYGNDIGHFIWAWKGVQNISSDRFNQVTCPVLNDNSFPDLLWSMRVVIEKEAAGGGGCVLWSLDDDGTRIDSDEALLGPDAGVEYLHLGNDMLKAQGGYYGLVCALPPHAWLLKYHILESSPTDENN